MLTISQYQNFQKTFYRHITRSCQALKVKLHFIQITSEGSFSDFVGDSTRESLPENIYELSCFYRKFNTDKEIDKFGVGETDGISIYISPIELFEKTGSYRLPHNIRRNMGAIRIEFQENYYTLNSTEELEPVVINGTQLSMGISLGLKIEQNKGNY